MKCPLLWNIAPRHVHLTLPKRRAAALYPRRTKNHRKCVTEHFRIAAAHGCFAARWGYPLTGVRLRSCLLETDVRRKHLFGQIGWSSRAHAVQQPWRSLNVSFHVNGAVEFQCLVACACLQMCCYVAYTGSLFYQTPVASSYRLVTLM